ncbi:unnamed protein product [Adineta ricciae]|uniref:Phage tail collar domain-containing protein n=1 Tax=Adineta ricciae TaxID=249248 RepID=A0A816DBZ5_ADIRI|nr:unnamed protein product [Adineta ricciae]CAF1635296.1 unnamed protein product [Adineta ricciae]
MMLNGSTLVLIQVLTLVLSAYATENDRNTWLPSLPIGTIFLYGGLSVPSGWILCDGTAISRHNYSDLYLVIGVFYGPGDHTTTFNLPDFRARFPFGISEAESRTVSAHQGGALEVTLTEQELPSHTHQKGNLSTSIAGGHIHDYDDPGHDHGGRTGDSDYSRGSYSMFGTGGGGNDRGMHSHQINRDQVHIAIRNNGTHAHEIEGNTAMAGSGKPFSIVPSYESVYYIIYAGPQAATLKMSHRPK